MQGALCTISVFFILHFTNLGVRTHPRTPRLRACRLRLGHEETNMTQQKR